MLFTYQNRRYEVREGIPSEQEALSLELWDVTMDSPVEGQVILTACYCLDSKRMLLTALRPKLPVDLVSWFIGRASEFLNLSHQELHERPALYPQGQCREG